VTQFIQFLARQKYRFDLGLMPMQVIQFSIIIIAAAPTLQTVIHVQVKTLVAILVPISIFLVWLIGWLMDKAKFADAYQHEQNQRNKMLNEVREKVEK
jgi:hypothetical protein